jgi:penicillin-binding protein 1C
MYRRHKKINFGPTISRFNWGKIVFFGLIGISLLVVILFLWYSRGLPDPGKVQRQTGYSTQILDRTGKVVLYDVISDQDRRFTAIADVPQYLKDATVAIEDKNFYTHQGFDPLTPLRIIKNVIVNHRLIGGSTLTQQLVKNVLLTSDRSISRKIREFILAVRIEKTYSKDEILQMYLNEAPYGGGTAGVAAAAQAYFGKEVKDLNLTECVILAGLPQSPSNYSPYIGKPLAYVPRAKEVAAAMRETGKITKDQETQVDAELGKVVFTGSSSTMKAPHFVMYIKQLLEDKYGTNVLDVGGLKVTTSLDWNLQQQAETIVQEEVDKVSKSLNIGNGASLIMDTDSGEILSMVGSKDYFDATIDGQVNVTLSSRQPGSSIKPLLYATAFLKGYSPATVLADVVTEFPGKDDNTPYIPKNYDGKEHGLLHLRDALASSINIPAVKLLAKVGVSDVLAQGFKMGFTTYEPTKDLLSRVGLSMALGGAEVRMIDSVSAYSTFSNGGVKVEPVAILKIEDSTGKVIYENKQVKQEQVLDPKVGFLINSILSDNNARLLTFGPNSYLNMGSNVAVKTGTTNDMRDNWTVGWSKDTIVEVWVGNDNNDKMKNIASGVSGAAPIWRREMLAVLAERPAKPFDVPSGVSQIDVDKISGYPAHDSFPSYKEWFINGTVPTAPDPIHTNLKICKNDANKLADSVSVSQGNYDSKEYVVIKEADPLTNKNLWQAGIDSWIVKQTDSLYKPPTETCGASSTSDIQIASPGDHSRVDGGTVSIKFAVVSSKTIVETRLYIDGTLEQTFTDQPYTKDIKVSDGKHSLQVTAKDNDGNEVSKTINFSMNVDWTDTTSN